MNSMILVRNNTVRANKTSFKTVGSGDEKDDDDENDAGKRYSFEKPECKDPISGKYKKK